MLNFKLIGFGSNMEKRLYKAICLKMLSAGFKHEDVVVTFMPDDRNVIEKETICMYGFSDDAKKLHNLFRCLPTEEIAFHVIDSQVKNLNGKQSPYVEVHANTPERIDKVVAYMKKRHLGYDVEKRIISLSNTRPAQEYEYPCVKVLTSEENQWSILMDVLSELRKLGVNTTYAKIINGSVDARNMQ